MKMNKILYTLTTLFLSTNAFASTVVATVNGNPITDTDITARTELMNIIGEKSAINRKIAFQNIVDDYVKINYANNFNVKPTDKDADNELKNINLGNISATGRSMARLAMRANIAWNVIIARTIIPTVNIEKSDINAERSALIRERGLPLEMEIIRLIDVPSDVAKKLSKPKSCDGAVKIAEDLGGVPQRITAVQYELSNDIRNRIADLPLLTWSDVVDNSVLLVCSEKKTKEYKNLDEVIKQNAIYRHASKIADQQLKQLRRKAVIIINDDRYKL